MNIEFTDTKYTDWYFSIIEKAKSKNRIKLKKSNPDYVRFDRHHIYPKSIWPELKDQPNNIVLLTLKEHFICHLLLRKCFSDKKLKYKMNSAFKRFCYGDAKSLRKYLLFKNADLERYADPVWLVEFREKIRKSKLKQYANTAFREKSIKILKDRLEGKTYEEIYGEEKALRMKAVTSVNSKKNFHKKGYVGFLDQSGPNNPMFGKNHTESTKRKMSEIRKGKYLGEDNPNFGRPYLPEELEKMSKAKRGKIWITDGVDTKLHDPLLEIPDGWKRGKTQNIDKENIRQKRLGTITITNGRECFSIKKEDFQEWQDKGYERGMITKNLKIEKNGETKKVSIFDLQSHLEDGWIRSSKRDRTSETQRKREKRNPIN